MNEQIESVAAVGSKMMYTGAGASVFFGLSLNEIGVIVGMAVGIVGMFINWFYKREAHKLKVLIAQRALIKNSKELSEINDEL